MTRIALIHALQASIAPINASFDSHWPEAGRVNLLDDSLSRDTARDGELTEAIVSRFLVLGRYARDNGADAILFTCSAFGRAIEAVQADLAPMIVHKPNAAMVSEAVARGGRIGLLASFAPTLQSMRGEFPSQVEVSSSHCAGALEALEGGDPERHDQLAAAAAMRDLQDCDVIALAQFSLARAAKSVAEATGKPVLTTPHTAVQALRHALKSSS